MIELGNNKLYLGDCLDIMKDIADKSIDMILCDLPYNITLLDWDNEIPLDILWKQYDRIIKDNGNIVLFSKQPFTTILNDSNLEDFRYELIWCKQQATNPLCAEIRIMPIHENISVFYKQFGIYNPQMVYGRKLYQHFTGNNTIGEVYDNLQSKHRACTDGSRYPTSVLFFNNSREGFHPTQKPVALCEYLIKTYTNENMVVLDNCMGSGTTGVACVKTKRKFIGIEKEEKYFNIAKQRIEEELKQGELF